MNRAPGLYRPISDHLLHNDYYLLLADFDAYRQAHLEVDRMYSDRPRWLRMVLQNIANMGIFSSDRTIRDYNRDIWRAKAYQIEIG